MRDMLGRSDAISVENARKLIAEHIHARIPSSRVLTIEEAYSRVLAEDIVSHENLPAFARSTVDGFAVISSDTFGATEGLPSYLTISHEVHMGEEARFELKKGTVARIPTGGMLPPCADAVVMVEHTQAVDEKMIEVLKPVAPLENVISIGEDVEKGETVLRKGTLLRPQDIAALAGIGVTQVSVYERPRVSIVCTGDEIVSPGSTLGYGQVRDVNSYSLAGLIIENGGVPVKRGIIRDVYEEIRSVVVESLRASEMVLITGGSSVGTMDMTARIVDSIGKPGVIFHGVALKPGKPTIGGAVGGVPVFGLPGHPAAVAVCFEIFIRPILKKMTGRSEKEFLTGRACVKALLAKNISSASGREEHIRVSLEERDGELWAVPVLGKSGLIRTLVDADGTVVISPHARGIEEGKTVEVTLF